MKIYVYDKPYDGNLKTYTIKVNTLIGKRVICYIIATEDNFKDFIHGGINNIRAEYNHIEYYSKKQLYKYTTQMSHITDSSYFCKIEIKFTKYMTFLVWKDRNATINKLKRFIKSPISVIKNTILKYKIKSKVQDFEEFYNK